MIKLGAHIIVPTIFQDGTLTKTETLGAIRQRLAAARNPEAAAA